MVRRYLTTHIPCYKTSLKDVSEFEGSFFILKRIAYSLETQVLVVVAAVTLHCVGQEA